MRLALLILVVLTGQLFVVSRAWLGVFAPDPLVPLAAFAALYWPLRSLLLPVVLLGWIRALVLVEPAGGQVLCAWASIAVVAGLRVHLLEHKQFGYVLGALVLAGCWSIVAALTATLFGVPVTGGRELVLGGLLSMALASPAVAAAQHVSRPA